MVVAPEKEAARVGMEVLRDGGNAIDAAVAVGLAIAVTFPEAGNLGGGGFLLFRQDAETYHALDFRERAPQGLKPEQFLGSDGRPDPRLSLTAGLAVGVPGTPAGLYDAHQRWGSLPWKRLVTPAIRLAEKGYLLNNYQERSFARAKQRLERDPEAARIFLRNGEPLQSGDRLKQPDLAKTLRLLAKHGPEGFYGGRVGEALIETVQRGGGAMLQQDLQAYRTVLREPLTGSYRGHRIVSFPPPSSGSVALLQTLAMLERFDLSESGPQSSQTLHRVAEATRRAYADRSRWLGDPDYFNVPVSELLADDYLAERSASIDDDQAADSLKIAPLRIAGHESTETTHVSIAAADGSAVSMTVTLNSSYGNGTVATGTGVLLNNEIDDFSLAPGVPNQYGLVGGKANAIEGGKRPLSSMTPTIVEQATPGKRPPTGGWKPWRLKNHHRRLASHPHRHRSRHGTPGSSQRTACSPPVAT